MEQKAKIGTRIKKIAIKVKAKVIPALTIYNAVSNFIRQFIEE
jgi:hypothetical protein